MRFSIKTCIKQSFPILTYEYWFIVMYILLLLISPLLNIIINNIKQEEYKTLIKLALFCFFHYSKVLMYLEMSLELIVDIV